MLTITTVTYIASGIYVIPVRSFSVVSRKIEIVKLNKDMILTGDNYKRWSASQSGAEDILLYEFDTEIDEYIGFKYARNTVKIGQLPEVI